MAIMPNVITLKHDLRPCVIDGRYKAMWHTWAQRPARGREGDVAVRLALVEFEDGSVDEVQPYRVRFLDTEYKMSEMEGAFIFAEERGLIKKPQPSKEAQP